MRLLEKSNTITVLNSIKESTKKPVKVKLYGKWQEYPSVEEAKLDMLEAMSFCDPEAHEYSRYAFVLQQLIQGATTCYDDIDEMPDEIEENTKPVPKIKVITDIEWETDGDQEALNRLPKYVKMPEDINADEVADYLSDEYGWLVNSCDVKWVTEDEYKKLDESVINESSTNINVNDLAKFIEESSKALYNDDTAGCYRFLLPDPRLAIYVGWSGGYGNAERDDVVQSKSDPDYGLNVGIKIRNDADWADYDWLNFPYYDDESGDVWDPSLSIKSLETEDWKHDAEYLISEYKAMLKEANKNKDLILESSLREEELSATKALDDLKDKNFIFSYDIEENGNEVDYIITYGLPSVGSTERVVHADDHSLRELIKGMKESARDIRVDIESSLVDENDFYGYSNKEELEERIKDEEDLLNRMAEELEHFAGYKVGIEENIKESVVDVKYIGKDSWDRHIVKDPKTGKFYGDVNLTVVGKDKDLSHASWHTYSGNDPYDGEPDMPVGEGITFNVINPEAIPNESQSFEYALLGRLKSDCKYFLGNGNGFEGHLWAGSINKQIAKMRELYDTLEEKPEWITMEDIDNYEKQMKEYKPKKDEE